VLRLVPLLQEASGLVDRSPLIDQEIWIIGFILPKPAKGGWVHGLKE
jgi:hypothetical protein